MCLGRNGRCHPMRYVIYKQLFSRWIAGGWAVGTYNRDFGDECIEPSHAEALCNLTCSVGTDNYSMSTTISRARSEPLLKWKIILAVLMASKTVRFKHLPAQNYLRRVVGDPISWRFWTQITTQWGSVSPSRSRRMYKSDRSGFKADMFDHKSTKMCIES
jgi:hypothetical protein